jgi:hypothetical protein
VHPPSHIALPGRKALLASLLAYEAVARHAPGDENGAPTRVVREMAEGGSRAVREIEPPPRSYPLDRWLEDLVGTTAENTRNAWGKPAGAPAEAMLDELARAAAELSCEACAPGRVCRGRVTDDAVVAARGRCLDRVFQAFDIAGALTEAYYSGYATLSRDPPHLVLSTASAAGKPHDIPAPVYLGAETEYRDEGRSAVSAVELQVSLTELDWRSWLSVLYVLLHECVCHAYAGTARPHRGRAGIFANDPFAEGWMDRVCGLILEDLAGSAGPARDIAPAVEFRNDVCGFGEDFRRVRARRARDGNKKASSVEQSVRAADAMFRVLQGLTETSDAARAAMFRLSFDFNLLPRTVPERAHVTRVVECDLAGPYTARFSTTAALVKDYLNHGNPIRLFEEFSRL